MSKPKRPPPASFGQLMSLLFQLFTDINFVFTKTNMTGEADKSLQIRKGWLLTYRSKGAYCVDICHAVHSDFLGGPSSTRSSRGVLTLIRERRRPSRGLVEELSDRRGERRDQRIQDSIRDSKFCIQRKMLVIARVAGSV